MSAMAESHVSGLSASCLTAAAAAGTGASTTMAARPLLPAAAGAGGLCPGCAAAAAAAAGGTTVRGGGAGRLGCACTCTEPTAAAHASSAISTAAVRGPMLPVQLSCKACRRAAGSMYTLLAPMRRGWQPLGASLLLVRADRHATRPLGWLEAAVDMGGRLLPGCALGDQNCDQDLVECCAHITPFIQTVTRF
jgi:hypothetical protein